MICIIQAVRWILGKGLDQDNSGGTVNRGKVNRGTVNRGTVNRGTVNLGTVNRGKVSRALTVLSWSEYPHQHIELNLGLVILPLRHSDSKLGVVFAHDDDKGQTHYPCAHCR